MPGSPPAVSHCRPVLDAVPRTSSIDEIQLLTLHMHFTRRARGRPRKLARGQRRVFQAPDSARWHFARRLDDSTPKSSSASEGLTAIRAMCLSSHISPCNSVKYPKSNRHGRRLRRYLTASPREHLVGEAVPDPLREQACGCKPSVWAASAWAAGVIVRPPVRARCWPRLA